MFLSCSSTISRSSRCATQAGRVPEGFTLIELILVMAMLAIVLGVAAPSLSRFFQGRTLDSEAKRFLALTRYGQSRAVSEGLPVLLWIDAKQGRYGLQADSSYLEEDTRSLEYELAKEVQLEVQEPAVSFGLQRVWKGSPGFTATLPKIQFQPDGFLGERSPDLIVFKQGEDAEICIEQTENGLSYEVQTNKVRTLRR